MVVRKSIYPITLLVIGLTLSSCSGEYISNDSTSSGSNNVQADAKEIILQACTAYFQDARAGDDIPYEDWIIMPGSALSLFQQAADLDYGYIELANAANLMSFANGKDPSSFIDEVKAELVVAVTRFKTACVK
jgi:hypothetical protein